MFASAEFNFLFIVSSSSSQADDKNDSRTIILSFQRTILRAKNEESNARRIFAQGSPLWRKEGRKDEMMIR